MKTLKGQLLMASPQLADSNFSRAVVFMIEHDENGAFGVILNHPSDRTVRDVWEELTDAPCECLEPINVGGPVEGPLIALHTAGDLAESEVMPGIYLTAQRENLDQLVRRQGAPIRLFSGYAGWGGGQLEDELKQGGWISTEATRDAIFANAHDLWDQVGDEIAQGVLRHGAKIRHFPDDPSLN